MDTLTAPCGATTPSGPSLLTLPFGGLGLDLAEAERKVFGLEPEFLSGVEEPRPMPGIPAPAAPYGYRLMIRLCRQTLGS